jgi:hypothetical protein
MKAQPGWRAGLWTALRASGYRIFSDAFLVRRAVTGDHAAFDALVARYRRRLYTLALESLRSEDKASDALRETVLSAFKDIDSFRARCSPGTWLYLHGIRAVLTSMSIPPGKYTFRSRMGADKAA